MSSCPYIPTGKSDQAAKPEVGISLVLALVVVLTGAQALGSHLSRAEPSPLFKVDLEAARAGYRASKLMHKPVSNEKDEIVGILEDVILGADSKANFALIDVGSMSLGPHIVIVPFENIEIDTNTGTIVLPKVTRADLQKLAIFP